MKLQRNDGSQEVRFTMRMELTLYERLKASAIEHKRSIAKEIEFGIEQYLKKQK